MNRSSLKKSFLMNGWKVLPSHDNDSLQQMLDSWDQEEYIVQRVTEYRKSADKALTYIAKHAHEPLLTQPLFQWEVIIMSLYPHVGDLKP